MSFALSLEDVKRELNTSSVNEDSLEMKMQTTISSPMIAAQTSEVYSVSKGSQKKYFEIKSGVLNQRVIMSDGKMKVVDLKTNKELPLTNGAALLKMMKSPASVPLETGNWKEPVFVADNVYRVESDSMTIYYDAVQKRLVKMEQNMKNANAITTFEYSPSTKQFSAIKISMMIDGMETKVDIVFSKYQNSKNFPDRFFKL